MIGRRCRVLPRCRSLLAAILPLPLPAVLPLPRAPSPSSGIAVGLIDQRRCRRCCLRELCCAGSCLRVALLAGSVGRQRARGCVAPAKLGPAHAVELRPNRSLTCSALPCHGR
jgi:hypothetical protein